MRKYAIAFAMIVLLAISCSSPDEAGKSKYDKGLRELQAGKTARALETFQSAASKYPESPDARFGMALYYYNEGFIYEAVDVCSDIIRDHTDFQPALGYLATLCLDIDRPELTFFFGSLYSDAGGDEDKAALMEVESFITAGKIDDANETIDKALSSVPNNPGLILAEARCELHSGNISTALENVEQALKTDSLKADLLKTAGDFYKELGHFDSAAVYYDKALDAVDKESDYYFKAEIIEQLIDMNYLARARKMLAPYADNFPASNVYYDLVSKIYAKQNKLQQVSHSYGMIVPNHSKSPSILQEFARTRQKIGDKFASERYFETAVIMAKKDSLANIASVALNLAYVKLMFDMGRFKNSSTTVASMLDSLPNDFKTIYNSAYLSMMFDERDRLHNRLLLAKPIVEKNPSYMIELSEIYRLDDSLDYARELLMEAVAVDKFNSRAVLQLVKTARKAGILSEALAIINSFDEYLSYNPDVAGAKMDIFDSLGEYDSGLQFAEQYIKVGREDLERYRRAAEFASRLGDPKKAEAIYQLCLDNNPDDPAAFALVGDYYLSRGDVDKAESMVNKALALDSQHIAALVLKGDLAAANGQTDEAIEIFSKVIELDQFEADAVGGLALQELLRGDNPNIAVNHAQRAITYDGGNAWHRTTLGRAYYTMKKYNIALNSFKNALELDPDNPLVNYYAGLNYAKIDTMKFEAKMFLKKAIKDGLPKDLEPKAQSVLKGL